jgi:hypothetical protein
MRRHTPAYGLRRARALEIAERSDADDADAIQAAFDEYAKWLEPEPTSSGCAPTCAPTASATTSGVRTVAVETELRIPLFEHEGR